MLECLMPLREFSAIFDGVARCLAKDRQVQAAYVFGSVATGRVRPNSDIDLAVLLSPRVLPAEFFHRRLKLMSELGAALHRSDVDVIILNEAKPLLAHRVLSKGKLIFERSASARIRFQVNTANRYADLVPAFETYIRYLKKSVREGRIVG